MPILRPLGQAGTTYIVAEGPAGLYLIDQHAAHERVYYERFLAAERAATKPAQALLAPVTLDLTPAQQSLITLHAGALRDQGFEIEAFGPGGYLLRSAPASLRRDEPAHAFGELLDLLTREDNPSELGQRVAASLACHAAIRAGQRLSLEEMRDLIEQLDRVFVRDPLLDLVGTDMPGVSRAERGIDLSRVHDDRVVPWSNRRGPGMAAPPHRRRRGEPTERLESISPTERKLEALSDEELDRLIERAASPLAGEEPPPA